MRERHHRLLLGVATGHLILAALGAGDVSLRSLGALGRTLDYYGALSGAGEGYGFFSPGVDGELGVRFDVIDRQGQKTTTSPETAASHEGDLRIGNILGAFAADRDDGQRLRRALAASFARRIFGRDPEAQRVVVRLSRFEPVSMGYTMTYGVDQYASVFLFYLMWIPAGAACSLDAAIGRTSQAPTAMARLGSRVLQLHLCLSYLASGIAKSAGVQWWNGELLWRALSLPVYQQLSTGRDSEPRTCSDVRGGDLVRGWVASPDRPRGAFGQGIDALDSSIAQIRQRWNGQDRGMGVVSTLACAGEVS